MMDAPTRTFGGFVAFMKIALGGARMGTVYYLLWFAIAVVVFVVTFTRLDPAKRRELIKFMIGLPAIWVFVGLWGGFFMRDPAHPTPRHGWAILPGNVAPWLALVLAGVLIQRAKGARWFVVCYAMINMYFVLFISFMSIMAVTGDWL